MRRLLRALAFSMVASGSLVIVLGIALFALAQTETFNRWLAKALQAALREQLNANLSIGSIRVRIFDGVELDSVALVAEGDTLLASPHIELRYIPEALIFRTVAIEVFRIESPRMHLVRLADGTWNIEHLLRPSSPPSGEPPSLLVYVRSFEIRSGTISTDDVRDTIARPQHPARFDPFHAMLTDVRVRATILALLRQRQYTLALDELSFHDSISSWDIRQASGIVAVDTASLAVRSLSIALPASNITIAEGTVGIGDTTLPYRARLALTPLHPNDAYHLLPPELALGSSLELDATVEGSLDSMRIALAHAATGRTHLRGRVSVHNLRSNTPLRWNAELRPSVVWWSDVRQLLRWLDLPPIAALDGCHIATLRARGAGDSLWADVRATTSVGAQTFAHCCASAVPPATPSMARSARLTLHGSIPRFRHQHWQARLCSGATASRLQQRMPNWSYRSTPAASQSGTLRTPTFVPNSTAVGSSSTRSTQFFPAMEGKNSRTCTATGQSHSLVATTSSFGLEASICHFGGCSRAASHQNCSLQLSRSAAAAPRSIVSALHSLPMLPSLSSRIVRSSHSNLPQRSISTKPDAALR